MLTHQSDVFLDATHRWFLEVTTTGRRAKEVSWNPIGSHWIWSNPTLHQLPIQSHDIPIWNIPIYYYLPIFCSQKSPWFSMVKYHQIRHQIHLDHRGKIRGDLWRRRRRPPRFTCIWQMPWIAPWSMKTWWMTRWINGILWWFNGI